MIKPKAIIKPALALFDNKDAKVRGEAVALYKVRSVWDGGLIDDCVSLPCVERESRVLRDDAGGVSMDQGRPALLTGRFKTSDGASGFWV